MEQSPDEEVFMPKTAMVIICLAAFFLGRGPGLAADLMTQADALYEKGGAANFGQAIELYEQALEANPDSYALNWKCARAYRDYGNAIKMTQAPGWKETCARLGKTGMQFAAKAMQIEPDKPEGCYYYGLNVGIYSDGVSILTALREGLKSKTQSSFEKAYHIDKMYRQAGPILALGRFWAVVPWPFNDKKKALEYYREYQQTPYFANDEEGLVYLAELLLKLKGKENKAEAKVLLEKAARSQERYYADWAKRLMAGHNL